MLNLTAAFLLAVGTPAAADIREISHIAFEICPKVLDGNFALDDPAFLAETSLTVMDKDDTSTILTRGEGRTLTRVVEMHEPNEPKSCGAFFPDSDDHAAFEALSRDLLDRGFQLVPSAKYPENMLRVFRKPDNPKRLFSLIAFPPDPKMGQATLVQIIDAP